MSVDLKQDVCVICYQMIKTLVFNIEDIKDMQKILLIQSVPKVSPKVPSSVLLTPDRKRSIVDDITKKYSNIKVRKISVSTPPLTKPTGLIPTTKLTGPIPTTEQTVTKILVVNDPKTVASKLPAPKPKVEPPKSTESHRSFMCISCSEKFQKFSQLEAHLKTCKTSTNQHFKCFCGKILASKQELSKHVSEKHKQNKRHICNICQKVVTSLSNLQNHMMVAHKTPFGNQKGIYICHVCNSKHSDFQGLKNHRQTCKEKQNES